MPKGVVLLADVLPSFLVKLTAPYYIHLVPYPTRIISFVGLSMSGMLLIATTPEGKDRVNITAKMAGVALASLSSGGGELSFLGLTHYYGPFSLAAWGSGTGGAGLIGAGAYMAATTWFGWSVKSSLMGFSLLPFIMLLSFFCILPLGPLRRAVNDVKRDYERVNVSQAPDEEEAEEDVGLLQSVEQPSSRGRVGNGRSQRSFPASQSVMSAIQSFKSNLARASHLFFP